MNTDTTLPVAVTRAEPTVKFLHDTVLAGARNKNTTRAYARALSDFSKFLQAPDTMTALQVLLEHPPGTANALVSAYRNNLVERRMAPASVNTMLGAIRSIVKDARRFGLINWSLDVDGVRAEGYLNTAGPGRESYLAMLEAVEKVENKPKRLRDRVILRLLHDMGLRRAELIGINLSDIDFVEGKVRILGKGRTQQETLTIPSKAMAAVKEWVAERGSFAGPLIVNLDRAAQNQAAGRRLSGEGVRLIVGQYGQMVGKHVKPHGLRHNSITLALEKTNGNIRAVQQFSRHKSAQVVLRYDDNRTDVAGRIANLVE